MPRQQTRSKSSMKHLAHRPRNTNCMRALPSFATSFSTSFRFAHDRITLLAPARCAPNTFSLIPPTGDTRPRSVICRRTRSMLEREQRKEVMLTSPVKAIVGGTHFPVKTDTIAQSCTRPTTRHFSTKPTQKMRSTYHSDTSTRSILLLCTCGKV
jgi:hypothetical protein